MWPELMRAYNSTIHEDMGFTPSNLMFGHCLWTPVDMSLGVGAGQNRMDLKGWVQGHHQKLSWAYALAKRTMDEAAKPLELHLNKPLIVGLKPHYCWLVSVFGFVRIGRDMGSCSVGGTLCLMLYSGHKGILDFCTG